MQGATNLRVCWPNDTSVLESAVADVLLLPGRGGTFAPTVNLCYTMTDGRCCASKRGYRDRFLVRDPLGALYLI
jgi:hypothetical protein